MSSSNPSSFVENEMDSKWKLPFCIEIINLSSILYLYWGVEDGGAVYRFLANNFVEILETGRCVVQLQNKIPSLQPWGSQRLPKMQYRSLPVRTNQKIKVH